jgi:alkanesulfonate monooxygenase SsuD/methylene tetrahydromethanopterin reductase-like flavin-dependent oxidoreductase (luciferase family)
MQTATVAQLSAGRFVLGLGTGGYGPQFWESMHLPDRPIAIMREYMTSIRQLLDGQTVTADGLAVRLRSASLGVKDLPPAPVYLGALGPQMLRLAGEVADGTLLNWATPSRIAASRALIAEGALRVGRDATKLSTTMYIRVCIDDDKTAARRAFGRNLLSYALARAGIPPTSGYRGLFAQMGFNEALRDLEDRRERGASMTELVDAAPDDLFAAVGYFGPAAAAAAAVARLSAGLDEAIVRVITARRGVEPVVEAMTALTPASIRAAASV